MQRPIALSLLLTSVAFGCDSSTVDEDPSGIVLAETDAAMLDELVGVWRSEVHTWPEANCPIDNTDLVATGWYLRIERVSPTTGLVRMCNAVSELDPCKDENYSARGAVVVEDGVATWTYEANFVWYNDLECTLHEISKSVLELGDDGVLTSTNTAIVTIVDGYQCAETEARMQDESGIDSPLDGCYGVQHNEFARVE